MEITLERLLSLIPTNPNGSYVYGAKADFARRLGIKNPDIIWDWQMGRSKSYEKYLYPAAQEYGVSLEWLKGETDERQPAQQKPKSSHDQLIDAIVESLDRDQLIDLIQRATEILRSK